MALPPGDSAVAYMSPTYLRTPIREYLVQNDKGVYWLRAPRDAGKTQLARGVIERPPSPKDPATMEGIDSNLASDLRAIGAYIRKDDPAGPRQFVDELSASVGAALGLSEEERGLLAPSVRYGDPAEARADLLAWLKLLHETVVAKGGSASWCASTASMAWRSLEPAHSRRPTRSWMCCPQRSELPQVVLLLLTSRPAHDSPAGLFERMTEKFGGAGFMARDLVLNDKEYVELLQKYFKEKLRVWFRTRCVRLWGPMLESKAKFEKGGRDQRLTDDPGSATR